jgi:hypothetical protein
MGLGRRRAEDAEAMSWDFDWESSVYELMKMVWVSDLYWDFDWKSQPIADSLEEKTWVKERDEREKERSERCRKLGLCFKI